LATVASLMQCPDQTAAGSMRGGTVPISQRSEHRTDDAQRRADPVPVGRLTEAALRHYGPQRTLGAEPALFG
jgi:hypothetical protein